MKEAWGKYGERDEAGALNRIGTAEVREAASLVRSGKVLSLAQPISPKMMIPKHRPPMQHFMSRDGGDYAAGQRRPGGFQVADDTIVMALHSGTHLDALCHCWYDDTLYNGFSANEVKSRGATRLGMEKTGPIATRGLLLDFVALNGGPLADGTSIDVAHLQAAIRRSGAQPKPGDAVLLRTGWLEAQKGVAEVDFDAEPGIDVSAALMLAEAGVALVGADNYAIEVLPFPKDTVFPVHQRLIRDYGVYLLEGLVLAPLAAEGASTFLFVAAALPIAGATGSPVNPVAVL
ncbi:MAG: cyclase family protein [Lautropia sp.]